MMQATVPPWAWVTWDRISRARAADEYARSRDRSAPRSHDHDKYSFYGLHKESRHFIRLDPLAKGLLLSRQQLPTSAYVPWRGNPFRKIDPLGIPDMNHHRYAAFAPGEAAGEAAGVSAGGAGGAGGAVWVGVRGCVAAAVALALLMLLVRVAENCLHKKLFKAIYMHTNVGAGELQQHVLRGHYRLQGVRRQESDEWSTPNVTATSLQHHDFDVGSLPRLDDIDVFTEPSHLNNDLPPPYSECARSSITDLTKYISEEPPPPYSACYVSYTNPKHGEPQVHIRRHNVLDERTHSSTDIDNVRNDLIENGLRVESVAMTTSSIDSEDVDPGMRMELVFNNGRIVERRSLDLSSNNNETRVASNNNVEEQSTRHAHFEDRVVFIDETASENTTPDRALLV